ncbi:tetratricopeptide repeat protein, partial [Acinetobacter baumannii]
YGVVVPLYFATAKAWYEKAAAQGDIRSQNNLGFMYTQGQGGHKDFNTAKFWYEKAAAQEDTDAQYNLGLIYLNGRGIGKDLNTAKKWFKQSCDNGNQQGCDEYRILNPH